VEKSPRRAAYIELVGNEISFGRQGLARERPDPHEICVPGAVAGSPAHKPARDFSVLAVWREIGHLHGRRSLARSEAPPEDNPRPPGRMNAHMERILRICAGAVWVAVFLLGGAPAWSQASASLRGNITDPSGAAIPNATVHLINFATNSDRTTTTDQRGSYTFADVIAGTYRLLVEAPGFEKYEQDDIRIQANAPATLDLKMTINQVQQSITVTGQDSAQCLSARARVLPNVGRGLRVIRQSMSGNYYVLTTPGSTVAVYSPDGKKIGQIPKEVSPDSSIVYGADLQLDSTGRIYVADRGGNAIKIYSSDGALVRKIPVTMPISVEPLGDGEVAVASLLSKRLVEVYDARGKMIRSFGELSDSSEAVDTKRLINRGWFYGDSAGNVYFQSRVSFGPDNPEI
jgi:hypothetical protein